MSKYLTITILSILLALLVLPQVASAARFPFEGPLVPCGRCEEWRCDKTEDKCPGGGDTCSATEKVEVCVQRNYDVCVDPLSPGIGDSCNVCHFFLLAQNIIDGFITIIIAIGTVMIGIGGFIILTSGGVPEQSSHGKKVITYTIIGLLVAFMSWMVVNETMLLLVGTEKGTGEQKLPWPWDKIECTKPEYKIIKEEEVLETPEAEATGGEYCVCETPRYAYTGSSDNLDTAPVIGTDIKVTELSSGGDCNQRCVSGNFRDYCYVHDLQVTLPAEKYRLYCATQSSVESKQACGMSVINEGANQGCQLGTTCYNSDLDCLNASMTTYREKCYLDGRNLCNNLDRGGSTYCLNGVQKNTCGNDPNKYVLYRWETENRSGDRDFNALECSQYATGAYYCRLNCQYETCQ